MNLFKPMIIFLYMPLSIAAQALSLPPDYLDPNIDRFLAKHAGDRDVPEKPSADEIALVVNASDDAGLPELGVSAKFISTPSANGVYEPGEHIVISVIVANKGNALSKKARVMLSGDPILLHFLGTKAELGDLKPGQKIEAKFDSGVLPVNLPANQFNIGVKVVDQDGFTAVDADQLTVATQPKAQVKTLVLPRLQPVPDTNENGYPHGAAVVVGIGKYSSPDAGNLRYASSDADLVAQYLVRMTGIPQGNVWVVKDEQATKSRIMATIQGKLSGKGYDPVIFYFAGHGIPDPDDPASGDACIVPYDGDFSSGLSGTLIRLNDMTRLVEQSTKGQALVMLDACFSGNRDSTRTPLILGRERGIAVVPKVWASRASVFSSTSGTQPSFDFDEQHHGMFTYFLLAGMQRAADMTDSGKITLPEAYAWVKEQVALNTDGRQVPELKNPTNLVLSQWRW